MEIIIKLDIPIHRNSMLCFTQECMSNLHKHTRTIQGTITKRHRVKFLLNMHVMIFSYPFIKGAVSALSAADILTIYTKEYYIK